MRCENCNQLLSGSKNFCKGCGLPIKRKKTNGCLIAVVVIIILLAIVFFTLFMIGFLSEPSSDYGSSQSMSSNTASGVDNLSDFEMGDVRDFYTTPKADGSDIHTIMVYMIGSDLESVDSSATHDIYEMQDAEFGDNINLILMTGGAEDWHHEDISSDSTQYWQVENGNLTLLYDAQTHINMVSPDTVSTFITDTASAFPADRYSFIFWNHGGGTLGGFGADEHYPSGTLTLTDLDEAFNQADVKFDFVGFDACLMGTIETAMMLESHADYFIASQESVPGDGWYYTDWLTDLGQNPSMSALDIGTNIVDDFVDSFFGYDSSMHYTLSVIELRQIPFAYDILTNYFINATTDIRNNEYPLLSRARHETKDFGDGEFEQIDIIDFIQNTDVEGGDYALAAVRNAVKYYRNSDHIGAAHGIAMYFPYEYPEYYADSRDVINSLGISREYTNFFNVFVSAMTGGQVQKPDDFNTDSESESNYSTEDWYDTETADSYETEYSGDHFETLVIDEKDGGYVLSLSPEHWEDITSIELQVLLDTGEDYVDLGSDNVYEFDEDGDLIVEFDYTWVSLDGNIVPFYAAESVSNDDGWYTYGHVPALLNGKEHINLIVYWDDANPQGYVAGYNKYAEVGEPLGKFSYTLEEGQTLEWLFDYYTYDYEFDSSYVSGEPYTVTDQEIEVSYSYVGDLDALIYFRLTDIYNNVYNTEIMQYYD